MQNDLGRLGRLLDRDRTVIIHADGPRREALTLEMRNAMPMLHFTMPEEVADFRIFVNGVLNTVVDAAGYSSKYAGVVLLEIDGDCYARTDMPMALLELLYLTTRFRLVIVCGTRLLAQHMASCAAAFGVPGMLELEDTGDDISAMIEQTVRRLEIGIENSEVLEEILRRYEEIHSSKVFNMDAFLRSLAVENRITMDSIFRECADEYGYVQMCMRTRSAERTRSTDHRIGFHTEKILNR